MPAAAVNMKRLSNMSHQLPISFGSEKDTLINQQSTTIQQQNILIQQLGQTIAALNSQLATSKTQQLTYAAATTAHAPSSRKHIHPEQTTQSSVRQDCPTPTVSTGSTSTRQAVAQTNDVPKPPTPPIASTGTVQPTAPNTNANITGGSRYVPPDETSVVQSAGFQMQRSMHSTALRPISNENSKMHLDKGELSSYSICSVNIQGLNSKKDDLLIFLNDERFDVICICEHWLSKNTLPSVNLHPYELITSYCRENIVHGGVAIYSLSKIRTKPIDLTKYCQPLHAEFCGVELFNRNTFLLSLYRSSASGNIHIFFNKLTDILHFLYNRYKYIIIVGDINLDPDKAQENLPDMTNLLTSFGLQYYINEPTRITNRSSSCLDNIITNISSTLVSAGVIKSDMSDHYPVFVTLDYYLTKPGNDADVQIVRAINDKRICKFVQKLRDTNWDFIHTRTSTEEITDTLIKTLSNCVNCCFPLIKKPVRHNQVAWFTDRLKEMRNEDSSCHIIENYACEEQLLSVNSIKIFHLNIQGIRDKIDSLNMFLNSNNVDIICLSEHWIQQKNVLTQMNIYGYRLVSAYCRPTRIHGGVCMFVKKNIFCKVIDIGSFCLEASAEFCALELSQQNMIIIVVYRSCLADISIFFDKFEELLYFISADNLLSIFDTMPLLSQFSQFACSSKTSELKELQCFTFRLLCMRAVGEDSMDSFLLSLVGSMDHDAL
nr:unnamed protein product [Callosobruchus analis]